ncbi:MAG: hypothetical protein ABI465_09515, partial [Ktedonobacteraceae bacterium]
MIVENDCLILQIFQMDDGETREEVPNGCDDPPAVRTRGTAGASQPRGTGGADRAGPARRWDRPTAPSVGYHDASHFNREYKSLFGVPPMRDVQRLRE